MPESKPAVAAAAPVAPVIIKQSSGKGVALGALVLSLLALGASGFLFVQGQNVLKTQELSLDQKINEAGVGQSKNAVLLENNLVQLKRWRSRWMSCKHKAKPLTPSLRPAAALIKNW